MDKIARKQALLDFLISEAKHYKPADYVRRGEAGEREGRKACGARLAALFANESDREDLLLTMHDLLTEWCHDAYLLGMRQGYALAKILKSGKGKPPQKAKAKIAQVLMENPKATTEEVCNALDTARIELYKSKSMPKDAEFWWEVVKVRYYRNLINRVGKQVAKATA